MMVNEKYAQVAPYQSAVYAAKNGAFMAANLPWFRECWDHLRSPSYKAPHRSNLPE